MADQLDLAVAQMWMETSDEPELDEFVNAIIERARESVQWLAVA